MFVSQQCRSVGRLIGEFRPGVKALARRGEAPPLVLPGRTPYLRRMSDIALSPSAAARVAAIAARPGKPAILRLSVDGGGCAGVQYRFGLGDAVEADDAQAAQDGGTLV